ncbi:helix-turn-helix domain-containing protein [Paenibacillus sp. GXUN7292]|uniref:helix-turn-helix domain-containing protein n=1 Tax=Paenibacillus sp. GXUN7292 TaxID=3422499 RepID=UPI003D7CE957
MEEMYTPSEFADLIGRSVKTLQRWDRTGRLVACRTAGNRRRYSHSQLLEVLGRVSEEKEKEKLCVLFVVGEDLTDVPDEVNKVFNGELLNIAYVIELIVLSRVKRLILRGDIETSLKQTIVRLCELHYVRIDI